ncbi:uncharacterized protein si:ch211-67e16.4 isoform X1 [Astyanax mexicanus]|uniref:uncharacterized protein si:ch211-67e16.4 isoform X1 n=1 Tax=Astyanax mexicanus TaxID=7994 RepID=UPI000BBDD4A0|nr:uncharacterized protein si:ch211-67e16.4 isoform X1 [Astyanax mexicanus]
MDVNLTISLMRGQMGVVIEKAVNAAVETVLGEMIRVVSLKFEEFRKEMNAKEKENENIRNMLEVSRCQMKTMRRYVNALTAREDRQALLSHRPDRPVVLQFESGRVRAAHHSRDHLMPPRRAPATSVNHNPPPCVEVQNTVQNTAAKSAHVAENTWEKTVPVSRPQTMPQPLVQPAETFINPPENYSEGETSAPKMHMGSLKGENSAAAMLESEGLVAESNDPLWGQTPPATSEVEHTDTVDSGMLPVTDNNEGFSTATAICGGSPPFKIKQEEGEVEIVHVKEEPVEAANSECAQLELCQQAVEAGPSISLDLPLAQQCHQLSMPSITDPGFLGVDPSTYAESQLAMAGDQRQVRPWCKDLNLYDEYKRKRIEIRKRSETRRRELEQTLPQALLADLVKERREKTRLRVARWRAKRKLQACLMSQASQLNGGPTQGLFTQRGNRRRAETVGQQRSFGALGRPSPSETGAYNLPLQIGSSPLLAAQRLGVAEGQMPSGSTMFPHHSVPTAGSEMFQ